MSQPDRRAQRRVTIYRARDNRSDEIWQVEYDNVAYALYFACRDLREGRRTPLFILQEGALIYDAEAIAQACAEDQARHDLGHRLLLEAEQPLALDETQRAVDQSVAEAKNPGSA